MSSQSISSDDVFLPEGMLDCFRILLAYEDHESALRGVQICDKLSNGLGRSFELSKVMWKFDLLTVPKMQQLAIEDAAVADMIIFAMHQTVELSESVCSWIEKALSNAAEKPRALVALIAHDQDSFENPALHYLRQLADSHKIDFFSNIERVSGELDFALPA
jgi:hypothetical protein